jgi:hypothetical protein
MAGVYRVDKFDVPDESRDEFWASVRRTHAVLREQPGFLDDVLLEKYSGSGRFNVVTIVRWSSADALASAGGGVRDPPPAAEFRPAEFLVRAGIDSDLANYREA